MKKIIICGIGNRLRGDDAVGPLVIDQLKKAELSDSVEIIDSGFNPERFAGKIISSKPDEIILIDAVSMNEKPGTVSGIPLDRIKNLMATTHKMPLILFIDYLQKSLPDVLVSFVGIQQKSTEFGAEISKECLEAVNKGTEYVKKMIE